MLGPFHGPKSLSSIPVSYVYTPSRIPQNPIQVKDLQQMAVYKCIWFHIRLILPYVMKGRVIERKIKLCFYDLIRHAVR